MEGTRTFSDCASLFLVVEEISSRNEITLKLQEFYQSLSRDEAQIVSYLIQGRIAPLFVPIEFNFSEKNLLKVFESLNTFNELGLDVAGMRKDLGDIGLVAEKVVDVLQRKNELGIESLSISTVYESLWKVAQTSGAGSVKLKSDLLSELLCKLSPLEARYLSRIVVGALRLGVSVKTILDAFSMILGGDKSLRKDLDRVYGVRSDLGYVASVVLSAGSGDVFKEQVRDIGVMPGFPVFPRLVERVKDFEELMERFEGNGLLQPKYDGMRCQIHMSRNISARLESEAVWARFMDHEENADGVVGVDMFAVVTDSDDKEVRLFSRNLEELSDMFPELSIAMKSLGCDSCVLDSEVMGWNYDNYKPTLFQETMTRRRKHDIQGASDSVPVKAFAFDILYLNGESLLERDLRERLGILRDLLKNEGRDSVVELAPITEITTQEVIGDTFNKAAEDGYEGLIAKRYEGGYLPGVRNFDWIKLKKSMDKTLVDTIDVVILGYYYGSGKQSKFGMGALLGGVYNREKDTYDSVAKIGTGVTEELWEKIAVRLKDLEVASAPDNVRVGKELWPNVWVRPEVVAVVEADEITKSAVHVAGRDRLGVGLALRFPRMLEFDRDKLPEDSTSVEELVKLAKIASKKDS